MPTSDEYEDDEPTRVRRRRKPLMVRVLVHDLATDETIRELTVDFNDSQRRKWLLRVQIWAFCTGKSVELLTIEADEFQKLQEANGNETRPRSNFTVPDKLLPNVR